jgi:hypothetical protein
MNVKIMGADQSVSNSDGLDWKPAKQASTSRSRLYKLSVTALTADVWVWIFDTAAGSGSSANPVMARFCPAGLSDSWDFGPDGSLYEKGIYLALASNKPVDGTTTPTAVGDDTAILKAEIRVG